jgi:non-ribosomal peptide synthetase component E (peptide arylation enzyme)
LPDLQLGLGIWAGEFQRTPGQWLRWCDQEGNWVLTETEQERQAKEQERRAKEQERRAKEQERQRADRLAAKLRELGIDPEQGS